MRLLPNEFRPKDLARRPFVRNVAILASGSAASQAITISFAPIITRMYGPESFGLQGVFVSVLGLLTTVAALGYPTAIVLPRSDLDGLSIGRLSIYIGVVMTAVVTLMLALFGNSILETLNAEAIAPFIYLIPFAMMISVIATVLGQWLIRKKAFRITAKYGVASAFVINSAKAVAGWIAPTANTLIVTNTFGQLFGTLLTYWGWRRSDPETAHSQTEGGCPRTIWQLAKDHADFPLLRTPQNLINAFSQSLPVLLLASFFGAASAGQYSIALAVLGMPSALIAGSVMSVFYPRITEAIYNNEGARGLIVKATVGMAIIGALPYLAILIAGPFLFEFVFGQDWHTAGLYGQLLAIWLFFQFINKPVVAAIPPLRLQGGLLVYEILSTGTKIVALWVGFVYFESDIVAVGIFSASGVAAYVWLIFWVIQKSGAYRVNDVDEKV